MERVHYEQERMVDELKDLVEKQLFTEKETKLIMKKRTAFERQLVRRIANKTDFLEYAAYEMGLEQLRRKRAERLGHVGTGSLSDYAFVRRQLNVFERAVRKFKSDVDLWVQYIEVAKREKARALVGRIVARALQLHPNNAGLYILAAEHEVENQAWGAARSVLQRGLRMLGSSEALWIAYVQLEDNYAETIRRRRAVLGLPVEAELAQIAATVRAEAVRHVPVLASRFG